MKHTDAELLYDLPEGQYEGRAVNGVRTVTWRAGRQLEVACFPITDLNRAARRELKRRKTNRYTDRLNREYSNRHVMRLIEANFTESAIVVTLTYAYPPMDDYAMMDVKAMAGEYEARKLPWEMERVRMDVRNWISRLRRWVRKLGGDAKRDFKWLVRIEESKEPPLPGIPAKFHAHAIVEAPGLDALTVKNMWEQKHGTCRADPLSLKDDGSKRLANYFCKQKTGGRWMTHSRNLKIVQPRVSDRKVSRRRLARLASNLLADAREIMEKLYPGYQLAERPKVRFSDYVSGAYVYVRMRRRD